ncbi:Metallophos domain-containing protein [Heracleum sosnowskyi]|uniref:Metallophos domain-containing protein n=1 Tax=Heracleum sosnowskyi TaxID=360622 RepID=A0AAD8HYL9_9APIA|nr:Metallophos domain-containing protein [Heracleum sosnowskyi]
MATSVRVVVVGDVHDYWNLEEDTKALELLKPDLVLFTGDFGNEENVKLVESIADLTIAKVAIMGNHDAWNTSRFSSRKKDDVQLQLDCLGMEHVGYKRLDFPTLKLSIVGGRPFSAGGERLFRSELLSKRYGIGNMEESAKRIYEAALGAPEDHSIIFLAHNGPTGLGSEVNDICGRDWAFEGGDHGDPDLADALSQLKETTKLSVPLVVFGHMHKQLADGNGLRKMVVVGDDSSIYLNGAIVPRVKKLVVEHNGTCSENPTTKSVVGTKRAFTSVEILGGRLEKIAETWVSVMEDQAALHEEHILFSSGTSVSKPSGEDNPPP